MNHLNKLLLLSLTLIYVSCGKVTTEQEKVDKSADSFAAIVGETLPDWSEGCLDIHSINSARGECTFYILPDGTTMLVDAGEFIANTATGALDDGENPMTQKPNATTRPFKVYTNYIKHFLSATGKSYIDYMNLSHFHMDHMGESESSYITSSKGYVLTGLSAVYAEVPFKKIVDRGYPNYDNLLTAEQTTSPSASNTPNYIKFVKYVTAKDGVTAERFKVGSSNQFTLIQTPSKYSDFKITNIVSNGSIWDGTRVESYSTGSENATSCGFLMTYGKFDWFTAGDLVGTPAPNAAQAAVALSNGRIDATKANHHMSANAMTSNYMSVLMPCTIVNQSFYQKQPDVDVLTRILSNTDYMGIKNVFLTNIHDNILSQHPDLFATGGVTGYSGHIVIRVKPGGSEYYVYILDDTDMTYRVKAIYGPYTSK